MGDMYQRVPFSKDTASAEDVDDARPKTPKTPKTMTKPINHL
jgi:hypothetical protein